MAAVTADEPMAAHPRRMQRRFTPEQIAAASERLLTINRARRAATDAAVEAAARALRAEGMMLSSARVAERAGCSLSTAWSALQRALARGVDWYTAADRQAVRTQAGQQGSLTRQRRGRARLVPADEGVVRAWLEDWRTSPPGGPDDWAACAHELRWLTGLLLIAERNGVDWSNREVQRDLLAIEGLCQLLRGKGGQVSAGALAGLPTSKRGKKGA